MPTKPPRTTWSVNKYSTTDVAADTGFVNEHERVGVFDRRAELDQTAGAGVTAVGGLAAHTAVTSVGSVGRDPTGLVVGVDAVQAVAAVLTTSAAAAVTPRAARRAKPQAGGRFERHRVGHDVRARRFGRNFIAFDGERLATGSLDTSVRIWNARTG